MGEGKKFKIKVYCKLSGGWLGLPIPITYPHHPFQILQNKNF